MARVTILSLFFVVIKIAICSDTVLFLLLRFWSVPSLCYFCSWDFDLFQQCAIAVAEILICSATVIFLLLRFWSVPTLYYFCCWDFDLFRHCYFCCWYFDLFRHFSIFIFEIFDMFPHCAIFVVEVLICSDTVFS